MHQWIYIGICKRFLRGDRHQCSRYEDPSIVDHYESNFIGDGFRYEISEFISKINKTGGKDYKLTAEESIAMADVVERFMAQRRRRRSG